MANIAPPDDQTPEPRKLDDVIPTVLGGFVQTPPAPTKTAPSRTYVPPPGDQVHLVFGEDPEDSDEPAPPPDPNVPFHGAVDAQNQIGPSGEALPPGPPPKPPASSSVANDDEDDGPPTQDGDLDGPASAGPVGAPQIPPVDEPEVDELARLEAERTFGGAYRVEGSPHVTLTSAANDDPWASDVSDQLGVLPDAKAFARLVVSKQFFPPLAVGVFGPWGSGKSFFMRLVHDHIEQLRLGQPTHAAPEADKEAFFDNV